MCKAYIFKDRGGSWRVRLVDTETKKKSSRLFATEDEARAAMPILVKAYRRPVGVTFSKAIEAYREHLVTRGNVPGRPNKPRTVETTIDRMTKLFDLTIVGEHSLTGELTTSLAQELWAKRMEGKAVDTQLNHLAQAKTFVRWLAKKGWLKTPDVFDGIEVLGRRKKGKAQLTEDESKLFIGKAFELGKAGDASAVAAATTLLLGMRTTEIVERIVRDLDAGGTKLRITASKTAAGIRTMKIPPILQPFLQALAKGKAPSDRLFGDESRLWVLRAVKRVCAAAGVPSVSAHGLRGTHARLAVEAGISGNVVAASLGHESFDVTTAHYAGAEAVANVAADRVANALN
jgi:integrase